mgnify:CR=1 FL=1
MRVCQCGDVRIAMDGTPWWPKGIIHDDSEPFDSDRIQTEFGSLNTWDYQPCLTDKWWLSKPIDGIVWGAWPKVAQIEVIKQDRKGLLLRINEKQIARIIPFSVGNDLSRMVQFQPWRESLQHQPILLPSMVYSAEDNDRVAVYDCPNIVDEISSTDKMELAVNLGKVHNALHQFSTPNTEWRWNDRLKDIEAALKTSTLWRAPHSEVTVGLPRLNIDGKLLTTIGHKTYFIADSRNPIEHLLCQTDRLPGLANLMMLEQQFSFRDGMNEADRKQMLESWLSGAPSSYASKKSLSTLLGGPWIWRYHAVLLALGEARMYGDENLRKQAKKWLNDVSRIQAHLGVLRLWKSGLWGGITGAVIAFFAWRMESVSPTIAGIAGISSLIFAITCNKLYWSKDPDPY